MQKVEIYTAGSCLGSGKNTFGGYCGIIKHSDDKERIIVGNAINTTNHRMELNAIIESIKGLKNKSDITVYSNNQMAVNAINDWLGVWANKNWKNSEKNPVANKDLWMEYLEVAQLHHVKAAWAKGHSGSANAKALQEAKKLQTEKNKGDK